MLHLPPLSLYIHFPWCVQKCPYCDFNSHALQTTIPANNYLQMLCQDLNTHYQDFQGRKIHSIFLGGGTPSLFPSSEMALLFEHLEQQNLIEANTEITIEANPGAIEHGNFSDYKKMGINRISLGVQSFQNDKLKRLDRIHNDTQVLKAVDELITAGFTNFNIDLMYGLPEQSVEDSLFDLQQALSLKPTHLSWYQLTIEPNTTFAIHTPALPNEETLFTIEQQGKSFIAEHGLKQYETSAYAKSPNLRSKHNTNYWQFGDYIGIGAGAHGKITNSKNCTITRHWKRKNPKLYLLEKTFPYGSSSIKSEDLPYEFMLNALRLHTGFSVNMFESRTGLKIKAIDKQLQLAQEKGLLEKNDNNYQPTLLGRQFLNDLLHLFI